MSHFPVPALPVGGGWLGAGSAHPGDRRPAAAVFGFQLALP